MVTKEREAIERRIDAARGYRRAAEVLDRSVEDLNGELQLYDFGPTQPFLRALALEIYLKCCAKVEGSDQRFGHDLFRGWNGLPTACKAKIKTLAEIEMTDHAKYSDMQQILKASERTFLKYRYDYEVFDEGSNGSQDFEFYPDEVEGLFHAFDQHICDYLNS